MAHRYSRARRAPLALSVATILAVLPPAAPAAPASHHAQFGDFGIDLTGMDAKAAPGDDFYRYANGAWDDRTAIPSDRASWGSFLVLRERAVAQVRTIAEAAAADAWYAAFDVRPGARYYLPPAARIRSGSARQARSSRGAR